MRREIDACAAAARALAAEHDPGEALARWLARYTRFVATKRGLAKALHSGDPAFDALPAYFEGHLGPALESLLATASAVGAIRGDVEPIELLRAVASLCVSTGEDGAGQSQRMVALLIDGLRYRADAAAGNAATPKRRRHRPK